MAAEYGYLKTVSKTKVQETIINGLHFILLLPVAIGLFASWLWRLFILRISKE